MRVWGIWALVEGSLLEHPDSVRDIKNILSACICSVKFWDSLKEVNKLSIDVLIFELS